jgi:hypothetical protein
VNRKQATKLAKEQARMAREEAKKARIAEAEKKKREAEARKFRDEIHLSTLVSLVHFTSDSRETIIAHFHQLFPQISQLQISRKISSSATKKSYHGGRRWVVNDDCLAHTKLDRTSVKAKTDPASASSSSSSSSSSTAAAGTAAVTPAAVPVPPLVLKDGTTELVVGTPEGDACLWKWFCGLTTELRMRFRYSEMDANAAAAAAGAAVKKKKKKGKLTMPVGWTAVQKVRATGNSAGQLDTVYHSPDGLTKCRSLLEIYRHLESQKNQATLNLAVPETTNKRKRSISSGAMTAEKPVASDKNIPKKRKKLTALKSVE